MNQLKTDQFYIGGKWVDPISQTQIDIINPANQQNIGALAMGNADDVEAAVKCARTAFNSYRFFSSSEKLELLESLAAVYQRHYDEMSQLITLELGAPIDYSSQVQTATGTDIIAATLEILKNFSFEERMPDGCLVIREPIGVCALITPWNWPINQVTLKVLPALAAGCTMLLKPSELTPLSALLFAQMIDEAGFPAGVFNLINGDGPNVGAAMSSHPQVDFVSFTGSTRAGISVAQSAAPTVKRVAQELGGKSPCIIFDDANLQVAISGAIEGCFSNSGQSCDAPTRLLINSTQYDQAIEIAKNVCSKWTVGDPQENGNHIGPVISQTQYNKIQNLIQAGIDEGARLICGGTGKPEGFETGYYVRPTVFANVDNKMQIAQEEIFGPVLCMISYENQEQAIEIANDTPYGLGAYIYSDDCERAMQVAKLLESGTVNINGAYLGSYSPFGGYKQSGNGREGGVYGLQDYLEVKAISGV